MFKRQRKSVDSDFSISDSNEQNKRPSCQFTLSMASTRVLFAILMSVLAVASAQSIKGVQQQQQQQQQQLLNPTQQRGQQPVSGGSSYGGVAPSPVTQLRQQQQSFNQQAALNSPTSASKQRGVTAEQQRQSGYSGSNTEVATEDPLADSEPALYGSVAGAPGVDFPAYTRIPKTSFTCEGKGFDFGFYADEEAQCQVYHVCWSGRRESFLCGVGTVFNQAILACDYWHSVDCSKSSQFYGVNSELGKAGAEPSAGSNGNNQANRRNQPSRAQATLPAAPASSSSALASSNFGEPLGNQRQRANQMYAQTQLNVDEISQQQQPAPLLNQQARKTPQNGVKLAPQLSITNQNRLNQNTNSGYSQQQANNLQAPKFGPQRSQTAYDYNQPQTQPQRSSNQIGADTKGNSSPTTGQLRTPAAQLPAVTTLATPQRSRFNMDFNQKVNSLIESPVRPPIKSSNSQPANQPIKSRNQQVAQPVQQQITSAARQQPQNFAQLAVSRAQQGGSQNLNSAPVPRQRSPAQQNSAQYQQQVREQQQQQQQQQQQTYDNEPELDQPHQQQQLFDDSPVQTSTSHTNQLPSYGGSRPHATPTSQIADSTPQFGQPAQQQLIIRAGGNSPDGSSAITSQYDTLSGPNSASTDSSYESSLDEAPNGSSLNDDFRSAGAKAAASHNQNWYIMRAI